MAGNYLSCDPNALLVASRCLLEPCASEAQREAVTLILRARSLLALGGANLTNPTDLQVAAKGYNRFSENERDAVRLYLAWQNAINAGAEFPQGNTANGILIDSKCMLCIPKQRRRDALLYLKCQLNSMSEPE